MSKKRGQLSLDEEKFIRDNFSSLSIDEIASSLNRSIQPIKKYIEEQKLYAANELKDNEILRQKLHCKTFWTEIERQFDKESGELEYFRKYMDRTNKTVQRRCFTSRRTSD